MLDGWGTFLGQLALMIFECVVIVVVAAVRFPVRCAVVALVVGMSVLTSAYLVAGVLMYTPVVLAGWNIVGRVVARVSGRLGVLAAYQGLVGHRLYSAWRRWWLYERRWQRTLAGQHLTRIKDNAHDDVPRLGRVTCARDGDTVRVRVLPGQTTVDFVGLDGGVAAALAKAFRARECRVEDVPQTDYIKLYLPRGKDALADTIPFPGIPRSTAEVDLRAIPFGVDERGRPVTVPIWGAHVLIGGITDSGKSGVMWSILLHLLPYVREGSVRLWGIDPKRGVELGLARNLFGDRYCDGSSDEIAMLLARAVTVMDDNSDHLTATKQRKITPTPERPINVIFSDELGRLADDKQCQALIKTLVNVGRAPGCNLVGLLQNPTKETMKSRDEWPAKVAMRLESSDYVKMLLGRTAYLAGARCDEIDPDMQGTGYIKIDRSADDLEEGTGLLVRLRRLLPWVSPEGASLTHRPPTRFRAFWVDDDLIRLVNEEFAPDEDEAGGSEHSVVQISQNEPVALVGAGAGFVEDKHVRDAHGRFAPKRPPVDEDASGGD